MKLLNLGRRTKELTAKENSTGHNSKVGIRRWLHWPKISLDLNNARQRLIFFCFWQAWLLWEQGY